MEFAQLQALVSIARFRSFARAAEHMSRTQPALSIAIKKLEEEMGVPLLERFRRDVRLTDAGKILVDLAQEMLNLRKQAVDAIDELRQLHQGKVAIGANESTNLYLLPRIILGYREKYPQIKIEVYRSSSVQLPQEIKDRNLDFGIVSFDPTDRELASFPILEDELVLITRPDHRLARKRKVTIQDLGTETFVAHNVTSPSRDRVLEVFHNAGVPLDIGIELSSIETIKQFVEKKVGIAFLPRLCIEKELREKRLITVPVEGFQHTRKFRVIYLRGKTHSQAASRFLDVLKSMTPSNLV